MYIIWDALLALSKPLLRTFCSYVYSYCMYAYVYELKSDIAYLAYLQFVTIWALNTKKEIKYSQIVQHNVHVKMATLTVKCKIV